MQWLIEKRLVEIEEPQDGCLVCYFTQEGWKHIGVLNPDRTVNSKWGTFPVYKHGIEEVPDDYGSEVRFYRKPSQADAILMFKEFALMKGIPADEI